MPKPAPGAASVERLRTTRDYQRARVYAWEDRVIAPRDPTRLPFGQAQGLVNAIWLELGLQYPPEVLPMPHQARRRVADANRLALRLRVETPSWCVLHELAHALTSAHDGRSDGHGPLFVGMYVQLLARYMRLDAACLLASLRRANIQVTEDAKPVFLDAAPFP
jgi:hypothetical protein